MSAITTAVDPLTSVTAVAPAAPVHPVYATWAPVWRLLVEVFEGSGGFLDGTRLMAHPREWQDYTAEAPSKPTKKLLARRKIARYENVAATILEQKKSALFRTPVVRTIGESKDSTQSHELSKWWQNVDGRRTNIDDYMALNWPPCGLFGHIVHVMDRPQGPRPYTMADQRAPYLRLYSPLDMPDWLQDEMGCLTAVKLLEAQPRTSLKEQPLPTARYQERIITTEGFEVLNSDGTAIAGKSGQHQFGRLPVVIQYAKRRALSPVIGQSVLGDPMLFVDDYNLTSELRELLRNQTFSILNIILGDGEKAMTVDQAITMLNATGGSGTENVLFSARGAQYVTAEANNIEAYQKERAELRRTMYRLANIPWETDTRDAEAEGSLKLKREDMNQILASYGDECEKAEYEFVELWFRAKYGESNWEQRLEEAKVVIRYPESFDVTPFSEILEQAQAAITIEMPPAFMKELRRRLVAKFLPDAGPDIIDAIDKELEKMAKEPPQAGLQRVGRLAAMLKGAGAEPVEGQEPPIKEAA
jgi:hypothetical protein